MSAPPRFPDPGATAELACLLECAAPKAGNVSPGKDFADTTHDDFVASARLIAPVFSRAPEQSVGATILQAVRRVRETIGKNTNLGMILLLAPLAAVPRESRIAERLDAILEGLTREDAGLAFEAIRLANPGGLGAAPDHDVRQEPQANLLEAMRAAADRDWIASEYASHYAITLGSAVPTLESLLAAGCTPSEAIVRGHLELMAAYPDTLIARKRGSAEAEESARRARAVLEAGRPSSPASTVEFERFDGWLRAEGSGRNPGATADLIAAALYVICREGSLRRLADADPPGSGPGRA